MTRISYNSFSCLVILTTFLFTNEACIIPKGIEIDCPSGSTTCMSLSDFDGIPTDPNFSFFATAIGNILQTEPGLYAYETPVQNHLTSSCMVPIYGAAAAFHNTALEMFGRADVSEQRRRCKADPEGVDENLWQLHRKVTIMYTVFWTLSEILDWQAPAGGATALLNPIFEEWGIDPSICKKDGKMENCDDISTPWGLARTMIDEIHDFMKRDGWNHHGNLPNVSYNKIPYADWRSPSKRYVPKNTPWALTHERRWQPLLEHDGQGFMFYQEHVVPHIGETARSIFLGDDDICIKDLKDPSYNLPLESKLALERTKNLTEIQKVEIEYFDNKLASLATLLVQQYSRMGYHLDSFEHIVADTANLQALREASIVVWRQKVKHDLVRPTSYIHNKMFDQEIESYGGPDSVGIESNGVVKLRANEWQPYIRVMPHAEFPSGSSCFCRAFVDTVISLTGSDDVTKLIGGPLVHVQQAGSSKIEKNFPNDNITLAYSNWSMIVKRCGETRLEGGMHFTSSVPAGEDLCSGIGDTVASAFKALEQGQTPKFMVDYSQAFNLSDEPRCGASEFKYVPEESKTLSNSDCTGNGDDKTKILAIVFGSLSGVLLLIFIASIFFFYSSKETDKKLFENLDDHKKNDSTFHNNNECLDDSTSHAIEEKMIGSTDDNAC